MIVDVKVEKKELIVREVKKVLEIVLYLALSLSLLATFKALVLIQVGINEFGHLYLVALGEAFVMGKVVALARDLPVMNAWRHKPLLWSVVYQSLLMTVITNIASSLEETIFAHFIRHHHVHIPLHPIIFMIVRQIALFAIFFVLFAVRGLDQRLGANKLWQVILGPENSYLKD